MLSLLRNAVRRACTPPPPSGGATSSCNSKSLQFSGGALLHLLAFTLDALWVSERAGSVCGPACVLLQHPEKREMSLKGANLLAAYHSITSQTT